jgi:hypothetical protein
MNQVLRTRRRLLAVTPVAAAVLLAIGNATLPKHSFVFTGTTEHALGALTATAAAPDRVRIAGLVLIAGYACLGAAFCALASMVRGRGGLAATAAAGFGVIGSVGAVMVTCWIALSVFAANGADITTDAKAGYLVSLVKTSGLGNAAGLPFLGGLFAGGVLMGVALFRSKAVPAWLAVLVPITLLPATLAAPQDLLGGLFALPLVAVTARLSLQLRRAADGAADDIDLRATSAQPVLA